MTVSKDNGIIDTLSNHTVDVTVKKLKEILQAKGITLFCPAQRKRSHRN